MDRKKKLFSTRTIRTQLADPSYKNGLLSVPDFIKAREFEIKSFELSQLKTKYASSNRVFQTLPRSMRRRTASHNVKRVPKRLRNRALKEMQDTNVVKKPKITSKQLYRLKMSKKLLKLASRIKLMKQVPESNAAASVKDRIKLLNQQIKLIKEAKVTTPLNNTLGSVDNTGINKLAAKPKGNVKYSKRQRDFVWLTTHIWHAKRFHMIKRWGYQIPLSPTQKCFRAVNRTARCHSLISDTSYYDCLVIDFDKTMLDLLTNSSSEHVLRGSKSYHDWLYVIEQGQSIPIGIGLVYCNKSTGKVLIRVHPSIYEELFTYFQEKYPSLGLQDCRYSLGSIDIIGPESLRTLNKVLHISEEDSEFKELFKNLSNYIDTLPKGSVMVYNIKDPRLWAYPKLPPIKHSYGYNDLIINLNKGYVNQLSLVQLFDSKGRYESYRDQLSTKQLNKGVNPQEVASVIPIMLTKVGNSKLSHWTMILPWYWVLPMWIKLNRVSHVQLAGLKQLKQINFENNQLSYPQDYPYLPEGWINNELEIKLLQTKYDKLPKSKKQFMKFERGLLPFGCDWEFLHKLYYLKKLLKGRNLPDKNQFSSFDPTNYLRHVNTINDLVNNINDMRDFKLCISLSDSSIASEPIDQLNMNKLPRLPVQLIKVELTQGSLQDGARIYYRDTNIENLIGFITSGSFNLNRGRCTGVGYVIGGMNIKESDILVRNPGTSKAHKTLLL